MWRTNFFLCWNFAALVVTRFRKGLLWLHSLQECWGLYLWNLVFYDVLPWTFTRLYYGDFYCAMDNPLSDFVVENWENVGWPVYPTWLVYSSCSEHWLQQHKGLDNIQDIEDIILCTLWLDLHREETKMLDLCMLEKQNKIPTLLHYTSLESKNL